MSFIHQLRYPVKTTTFFAAIAWETNLPAKTYIEYGPTTSYGQKTNQPERFFYTHLHYLKDLDNNKTEVYSSVAEDGSVSIPLTQSIIRPVEWEPEGDEVFVTDKYNHQETKLIPYTVKAEINGSQEIRSIYLDKKSSLRIVI